MNQKKKRVLSFLIDYIIILIIIDFIMSLWHLNVLDYFYHQQFFVIILYLLKDLLFYNASIGKKICGIEILKEDNSIPSTLTLIIRNILLILWPLDFLIVLATDKKICDMIFKTKVVNIKKNKLIISKKNSLIILIVILIMTMLLYYSSKQPPIKVILNDDLTVLQNEDVTDRSFIKKIENGRIITEVQNINTSKLGKKKITFIIKSNAGKIEYYTFYINVIEPNVNEVQDN